MAVRVPIARAGRLLPLVRRDDPSCGSRLGHRADRAVSQVVKPSRRPREHVLETASIRRFERAIPPEWTTHAIREDYGIDLRVEIFERDEHGDASTTGLEFGVQLKATDSEESDGTRVGVGWHHVEYWRTMSYPVLVVRYLAQSDRLYGM